MVPLQDRTARLQQANTTLASRMHTLLALTRDVRKQVEQIDARAQDTLAHLRAAAACRSHMQQQIQHAQLAVDRLQLDAHAETLKIARLQYELRQLHARRDGAQHDIQQSRSDAAAAQRARAQELKTHECQGQRLQASADESAVRCEVVALMAHRSCVRELLQTQALDALLALCRRSPAVRAKLVANGLQSLVLETLQRFRASERVAMSGCALVVLLTQSACCDSNAAPAESPAPTLRISGHLAAWPTRVLVSVLTSVTLGFADSLSFEAICQTTHVALQSLRDAPQLSDVDETELRRLVRDAHATIVHHASFTRLDGNPALQRALQHAAR